MLKKNFNFDFSKTKFIAGHSLGEYSALVSSESLTLEDGLKLVHERGKLMQAAVPEGRGAMLAVMGIDIDELNSKIKKFDKKNNICEIANDNSPGQIILSGAKQTLTDFSNELKT